jgi:dihydrofolate synthase / folylpolyglutamate synthase
LRGKMQLRNAATALCALDSLRDRLPIAMQDVRRGLAEVGLAARFQVLPGRPQVILDVAHNPEAAGALAENLGACGFAPQTLAVCGMLRDKDITGVLRQMMPLVTQWHLASLSGPRAAPAELLAQALRDIGVAAPVFRHGDPVSAFASAEKAALENDKIVVFGSFLTVGEVMAWLKRRTSRR